MVIKQITQENIWKDFISLCKEKSFLISWNWGNFQKAMGHKIWRLGIFNDKDLDGVALVIKIKAKRGSFLFVPHGPVVDSNKEQVLKALFDYLKELGKQEKCWFIRIAPIWDRKHDSLFSSFRTAPIHMHPELTWELDITLSEKELLKNMRKTTRYLIKHGIKNKDLIIEKSIDLRDLDIFHELYTKTVASHHFTPFSKKYLENEVRSFLPNNVLIFQAKHMNEYLASGIIIFSQGMAFYHQGASVHKNNIPASYLLQWEAIKEAKKKGYKIYNFWGIADTESKKHPWWGLSLFKKGFSGYVKEYVKTKDYPLSPLYYLTFVFEKLRKAKRHL